MTQFRVASKANKETEGEKCPKCLTIWQDFGKIEEHLWFCYACGTVFVPKKVREPERWGKKEQILKQMAEEKEEVVEWNFETTATRQTILSQKPDKVICKPHQEKEVKDVINGTFSCPHCDYVGKTKLALASHMKKHKNENR